MKNIIILGRPRAGKSTLANMIVDKYNYQIIRTDTIRSCLKDVFPELNIGPYTAFLQGGLTYEYGKIGVLTAINNI